MAKFQWEDYFTKEGIFVFTQQDVVNIRRIQNTYSNTYLPFLEKVLDDVGPDMEAGNKVGEVIDVIRYSLQLMGKLLGPNLTDAAAKNVVRELADAMDRTDREMKWLVKAFKRDDYLSEQVAKAEEEIGVQFKDLANAQRAQHRQLASIKPPGKFTGVLQRFKGVGAEVQGTVQSIGAGLATAALGPFAGLAGAVGGAGVEAVGAVREMMRERREQKAQKLFAKVMPGTPEERLRYIEQERMRGPGLGKVFTGRGVRGYAPQTGFAEPGVVGMPRETAHERRAREQQEYDLQVQRELGLTTFTTGEPAPAAVVQGVPGAGMAQQVVRPAAPGVAAVEGDKLNSQQLKNAAQPIWYFFDKLAYQAKWTRDLLKGQQKEAKEEGGMGFLDFLKYKFMTDIVGKMGQLFAPVVVWIQGTLLPVLGAFAQGLSIIGAGLALGYGLFRMFPKFFTDVNDRIRDMFVVMIQGWRGFLDFVRETWKQMVELGAKFWDVVTSPYKLLGGLATKIGEGVSGVLVGLKESLKPLMGFLGNIMEVSKNMGTAVVQSVQGMFTKVGEIAVAMKDKVLGMFSGLNPKTWFGKGKRQEPIPVEAAAPGSFQSVRETVKVEAQKAYEVLPQEIQKVIEKVPLTVDTKMVAEKMDIYTQKVVKALGDMSNELKRQAPSAIALAKQTADNVRNIGDPLLERLGLGGLSLEE